MKKYRCKWCGYEFSNKGDTVPGRCPYCNESDKLEECFDSKKLIKEVDEI